MKRGALASVTTLLLTVTACSSDDTEAADAVADDQAASAEGALEDDAAQVPVERSTELLDPEGSTVGAAWLRDSDGGDVAELEVQVAGLTQGFHGIRLYETGSCEAVGPEVPSTLLPPVLVLENGVGSITTLVGPVSLDELVQDGDVTVVVDDAAEDAPEALVPGTGSQVACGAFAG